MANFKKKNVTPLEVKVEESKKVEEVIQDGLQEIKEEKVTPTPAPVVTVSETVQEKPKPTTKSVIPNKTFRTYLGNRWYDFVEGESQEVPVGVIFELRETGNII